MTGPATPARQLAVLTRTFLISFFDNDLTASSHDRKEAVIWLMGLLAAPGFIFPITLAGSSWGIVAEMTGVEVVRDISRDYKVIYLGLSMAATGLVAAVAWNQLLIDRRDALVLGVLPVRPATVATAKLLSVLIGIVLISAVMHLPAAVAFGGLLSAGDLGHAVRGGLAHFAAASLASAFVLLSVLAAQSLLILVVGPQRVVQLSGVVLAGLVAAVLLLLVFTPPAGTAVRQELRGADARYTPFGIRVTPAENVTVDGLSPWLEASPPVWYFGVSEAIVGAGQPAVTRMARRGLLVVGVVLVVTLAAFPLACRRLLTVAVAGASGFGRTGWAAGLAERLTRQIVRHPTGRAAASLVTATAGRVPRHRLIVAGAIGGAIAVVLPVVLSPAAFAVGADDRAAFKLLALPYYVSTFLIVALRLVIRAPGELRPGWLLALADVPPDAIVTALRRLFLVVGVVPALAIFTPLFWWAWGPGIALTQAILVTATCGLFSTAFLFRWSAMPCAEQPGGLDQGRIGRQVVLSLLAFLWITSLPVGTHVLAENPGALAIVVGLVVAATAALRVAERAIGPRPRQNLFDPETAFQTLGLTDVDLRAGDDLRLPSRAEALAARGAGAAARDDAGRRLS